MDRNRSELFGQFSYDDSLTYEELLVLEKNLVADVQALLLRAGGTHLDFTPLGDALMFQCAFEAHKVYVYHKIAQEMARILPHGIHGRLLCLDKHLAVQHLFWIERGQWQTEERTLPPLPPDGLKVWRVPVVDEAADEGHTDNDRPDGSLTTAEALLQQGD